MSFFFTKIIDGEYEPTAMHYHIRTCAGVKVCEYFPETLKVSHTEVDLQGLEWARLLAEQERAEANTSQAKVDKIFETYRHDLCDRPILGGKRKCGGKSVVRSRVKASK
jgi:hypothetical protein